MAITASTLLTFVKELIRPPATDDVQQQVELAQRSLPTGVTVVAANTADVPVGLAVNAFTIVSMVPPTVLICIPSGSRFHLALSTAQRLGISILSDEQLALASALARSAGDEYRDVAWHHGEFGSPMLDRASICFEVEVTDRVQAGTYSVFFGRIVGAEASRRPPLLRAAAKFLNGSSCYV